jgi:hypothetical protein
MKLPKEPTEVESIDQVRKEMIVIRDEQFKAWPDAHPMNPQRSAPVTPKKGSAA